MWLFFCEKKGIDKQIYMPYIIPQVRDDKVINQVHLQTLQNLTLIFGLCE